MVEGHGFDYAGGATGPRAEIERCAGFTLEAGDGDAGGVFEVRVEFDAESAPGFVFFAGNGMDYAHFGSSASAERVGSADENSVFGSGTPGLQIDCTEDAPDT